METSPLIKVNPASPSPNTQARPELATDRELQAHDHARAASTATQTSDTTVAINEHALAAGEFSNAANSTTSIEALRTLRLLEQHHQRLSELLKYPSQHPVQPGTDNEPGQSSEKEASGQDARDEGSTAPSENTTAAPVKAPGQLSPVQQRRYQARDLSSSIASNLASARGIRSKYRGPQPLAPSISNEQAPGNLERHMRREGSRSQMQSMLHQKGKPSWIPPSHTSPTLTEPKAAELIPPKEEVAAGESSEEGFSRFYNTFGSIFNRLSAPLAFAGLPLITEESATEVAATPETSPKKRTRPKSATITLNQEPDLSQIYSKAALRALSRDGHGPNDSFYVVPKTGHTASYANILSFDQKEKRRMAASIHADDGDALEGIDEDDFVDARETQGSLSPGVKKRLGRTQLENVVEELYTENASLKDMLDKLSKRLHAFEANAQNSHLALQESMRLIRPNSPTSAGGGPKAQGADETLRRRNAELEEQLAKQAKQMEVLEKEYGRMERTLVKYRDKWDKLKAGAKARREAQGSADNAESSKPAT